jgi:hypothetical protein
MESPMCSGGPLESSHEPFVLAPPVVTETTISAVPQMTENGTYY